MPRKKVENGPYRYGFKNPADPAQTDFVSFGSEVHMRTLNLRKAKPDDDITYQGFAFEDVTRYGPMATDRFLKETLAQLVNSFTTIPPEPQSDDLGAPNYSRAMFLPTTREEELVRGIV